MSPSLRAFSDGREAAFFGRLAGAGTDDRPQLHAIDLESLRTRPLGRATISLPGFEAIQPVAVSRDGLTMFTALFRGNASPVVANPRLAASSDGATLYFVVDAQIWSVPASDGQARIVTEGTALTVDPAGRFLVFQRPGPEGFNLFRRNANGTETRLPVPAGVRVVGNSLWAGSLATDGRLLMAVESETHGSGSRPCSIFAPAGRPGCRWRIKRMSNKIWRGRAITSRRWHGAWDRRCGDSIARRTEVNESHPRHAYRQLRSPRIARRRRHGEVRDFRRQTPAGGR